MPVPMVRYSCEREMVPFYTRLCLRLVQDLATALLVVEVRGSGSYLLDTVNNSENANLCGSYPCECFQENVVKNIGQTFPPPSRIIVPSTPYHHSLA